MIRWAEKRVSSEVGKGIIFQESKLRFPAHQQITDAL